MSPAKRWPYRFRSWRMMLALPYRIHDLRHLCFGRRIQISGHSAFGIFALTLVQIFHIDLALRGYCVCCLSMRNLVVWIWYPWLLAAVICDADDPCSVNTAWWSWIILHDVTTEYDSAFVLLKFDAPTLNSWDGRGPSMTRHELFCLYSLLHRSPLSCFWLSSAAMPVFSQILFSHSFSTAAFAFGIFYGLRHRNGRNLRTKMVWWLKWIHTFRCSDMIFVIPLQVHLQTNSRGLVSFDYTRIFCLAFPNTAVRFLHRGN